MPVNNFSVMSGILGNASCVLTNTLVNKCVLLTQSHSKDPTLWPQCKLNPGPLFGVRPCTTRPPLSYICLDKQCVRELPIMISHYENTPMQYTEILSCKNKKKNQ